MFSRLKQPAAQVIFYINFIINLKIGIKISKSIKGTTGVPLKSLRKSGTTSEKKCGVTRSGHWEQENGGKP